MTHECYISYEGTLLTLENYWDKCLFSSSYAANHHEFIHLIVEYVHERLQREESSVRKKKKKKVAINCRSLFSSAGKKS